MPLFPDATSVQVISLIVLLLLLIALVTFFFVFDQTLNLDIRVTP